MRSLLVSRRCEAAAHKRSRRRGRRGAAVVELAVCLPAIFLIAFGAIEATSMAFMRQALVQSAYEAAKESVRRGGNQADGLTLAQQVLASRDIQGAQISFNPGNVDAAARGTQVVVNVVASVDDNTVFPFGPFAGKSIEVQATMIKEE